MLSEKKKIYNIILEKQVKEAVDKIAKLEDRSGSSMVNWILKKYINEYNLNKEK
jgi:metal-responsive CopG/Arc/MetJ family transcriptional regulator